MTKFDYLTSQTFDLNDWRAVDDLLRTGNQSQQSTVANIVRSNFAQQSTFIASYNVRKKKKQCVHIE